MKNLFRTLKKVSLLILVISFIGCDDDEAFLPQLTAGFTHTINANTGTVTFINTSTNASTYDWDFGDEVNTSRLINPVNVYENGTYLVNSINYGSKNGSTEVSISVLKEKKFIVRMTDNGCLFATRYKS